MGLQQCFRAQDKPQYEIFNLEWAKPISVWANYLSSASPRICAETMDLAEAGHGKGVIWVANEKNPWADTTIHLLAGTQRSWWPGWGVRHWLFDGQYGRFLDSEEYDLNATDTYTLDGAHDAHASSIKVREAIRRRTPAAGQISIQGAITTNTLDYVSMSADARTFYLAGPSGHSFIDGASASVAYAGSAYELMTSGAGWVFEPAGFLWTWGGNSLYGAGDWAAQIDPATLVPTGVTALNKVEWEAALRRSLTNIQDLAIDQGADRVFVRFLTDLPRRRVGCYRLSTKELLGWAYTPNATSGIVLTNEHFAYIFDDHGWVSVYDYDAAYQQCFKHPPREETVADLGGAARGWDPFFKRILIAPAIANSTDGQCRMRIRGYYPVPQPAGLTPPLPVLPLRTGQRTKVFTHLYGEGAEPLAARQVTLTGAISGGTVATDKMGDATFEGAPLASGDAAFSASCAASVPAYDDPEPEDIPVNRSLVVRITSPADRAVITGGCTFTATVEGAVGTVGVGFYGGPNGGGVENLELGATGSAGDPISTSAAPAHPHVGYLLTAVATDSTGNQGLSQVIFFDWYQP